MIEAHELHPNVQIVERVRYSGRAFLNHINTLCVRIDGYTSRIDKAYAKLNEMKSTLVKDLQLKPDDLLTPQHKSQHPLVGTFFQCFGLIRDLKLARRKCYRKIAAVKKNWFGMLSNVELRLAKEYSAALVREDLTVEAIEKDAPDYKGRRFNKMINNGSKGQYQKRASDKMLWNGVPEIIVPSWYTSRSCLKHSKVIEKHHRKGESIFIPCCDKHDHADEHAADTIACYPLLQPRLIPKQA